MVVALAAVAVVSLGPGATRAFACNNETGVFWSDSDSSGNIIYPAYGSYAQITESNHTLNCNDINGSYSNGQTVRVLINGTSGHYSEVGWAQKWCSSGVKCQRAFYEYKWGNNASYQAEYSYSCLNPGTREAWEMIYSSGVWWGYLSCYTTGAWQLVDYYPDSSNVGYADNEGFQNSSLSGASNEGDLQETHSVLEWMNSSGSWVGTSGSSYPGGVHCRYDTSNHWNGNWLSGSSFNFSTSSNGESCGPSTGP